jgi:hypothetical protein
MRLPADIWPSSLDDIQSLCHNGVESGCSLIGQLLAVLIHNEDIVWCCACFGMALLNNLVSIVMILDGQVLRLQYSINLVMHGDSVLPLVGEIQ